MFLTPYVYLAVLCCGVGLVVSSVLVLIVLVTEMGARPPLRYRRR